MTQRIITKEQIFSGWSMEQFEGSKYSDIMYFVPERGCFELRGVACRSGVDGTCQCNSHETYDFQDRDIQWGFETLKKWGFVITDNVDWKKTRRRVEDALRKNTSNDQLFAIAGLLNIKIEEEPILATGNTRMAVARLLSA